jgi:hypothetical protein
MTVNTSATLDNTKKEKEYRMKRIAQFIIKFILVSVILEVVLNLTTDLIFGEILIISLTVTALSFLLGDLLILSRSNNIIATIVDLVLATLTIYIFNYIPGFDDVNFDDAIISSVVLGVIEWFFHRYLLKADRE